jgi:hypothetical protein
MPPLSAAAGRKAPGVVRRRGTRVSGETLGDAALDGVERASRSRLITGASARESGMRCWICPVSYPQPPR